MGLQALRTAECPREYLTAYFDNSFSGAAVIAALLSKIPSGNALFTQEAKLARWPRQVWKYLPEDAAFWAKNHPRS